MSHYKPYSAYKDSGVEWVGGVPSDWGVAPLFAVASERNESNKGMVEDNLLSLSYGSIVKKDINTNDGLLPESFETYQIVRPGDIIFRLTDLQNDKRSLRTAVVSTKGIITSAYVAVSPKSIEPRYFNYLLRAYDVQKVFYSMGGGMRQSMKFEDLRRMPILVPGKDEQELICEMLDRETVRIDGLVSKKTSFIELLREKRQALINHAVTKGLVPTVKMKDSGVAWLGEVPEHWTTMAFARVTMSRCDGPFGSAIKSEHYKEAGVRVIRLQNIGLDIFKNEDKAFLDPDYCEQVIGHSHDVKSGDLLVAGLGDANNPLGRTCVAPEHIGRAIVKADCYRFRVEQNKVLPAFLALQLSATAKVECGFISTGSTRERLNLGLAASRTIAVPPTLEEQSEIVGFVLKDTTRIDTLINKSERSIELLKERRSALITAAVTGQIDVRENTARQDQLAA